MVLANDVPIQLFLLMPIYPLGQPERYLFSVTKLISSGSNDVIRTLILETKSPTDTLHMFSFLWCVFRVILPVLGFKAASTSADQVATSERPT